MGDGGLGGVQDGFSDRVLAAMLQADVLQDAELQGGQRCLQIGPTDVLLRQPLEERLRRGSGVTGGPAPHRQLVPVDQSPKLLADLSGNLR